MRAYRKVSLVIQKEKKIEGVNKLVTGSLINVKVCSMVDFKNPTYFHQACPTCKTTTHQEIKCDKCQEIFKETELLRSCDLTGETKYFTKKEVNEIKNFESLPNFLY